MPVPAELPVAYDPVGSSTAITYRRELRDPLGRAYRGRFTVKRLDPPFLSAEGEVVEGRITILLEPGRYTIGAMLRDPDGVRAYIAEEFSLQEGS